MTRTITQQLQQHSWEYFAPLSADADRASAQLLRELPIKFVLDMSMRKFIFSAATCAAIAGAAVAQIEATSSMYFLDVDPARYAGPAGQRLAVILGDEPRHVTISDQDEICVQLQRSSPDSDVIDARLRVLRPEPHEAVVVRVAGPGISPGTFRSTPWGMLLRVKPSLSADDKVKPVGTNDAPVCTI